MTMSRIFALAGLLFFAAGAHADSLYKPGTYQALTSDLRVRHVGDLITVMVYENASASSAADTSAGREASVGFDAQGTGKRFAAGLRTNNNTDGRGRTQREGKVLAQITVAIKGVTESGDLIVAGEQLLEINNERQEISIEGRIRPQDVSDTNTVLSTRIANARIRYAGQGDLADKQRPAWWQRFLTLFGL
jgi:flagellar L-ring protein precursor FlgH